MRHGPDIAATAQAIADPARAAMLDLMMDGRAYTAGELAAVAGVTPQTASQHLARLVDEGFVAVERQGRHRYHRIAGPEIAAALEGIIALAAATGRLRTRPGPRDPALREARICYDHLAGTWGARLFAALVAHGTLAADHRSVLAPTAAGRTMFEALGVEFGGHSGKRPLCRACLDWSERKPHLGGWLGAELLRTFIAKGWLRRQSESRALDITPTGRTALARLVGNDEDYQPLTPARSV